MLLDLLNRPIMVGDTVLTRGYMRPGHTTLATIIKVNRTTVTVNVPKSYWLYDAVAKTHRKHSETSPIRRAGKDCIIVNEQLAHNREHYPEFAI